MGLFSFRAHSATSSVFLELRRRSWRWHCRTDFVDATTRFSHTRLTAISMILRLWPHFNRNTHPKPAWRELRIGRRDSQHPDCAEIADGLDPLALTNSTRRDNSFLFTSSTLQGDGLFVERARPLSRPPSQAPML